MIQIILAFIGSGAIFTFIQFLINRKDQHDEKLTNISDRLEDTATNVQKLSDRMEQNNIELRDQIDQNNTELKEQMLKDKALVARVRILRASDEILHKMKHSKEWFDQLNEDISFYEKYCKEHPTFVNNKASHAIASINSVYAKALKDNDFL